MPRVELIRRADELTALRDAWRGLYDVTPGATFFQTLDWLEVYWRHYGDPLELRLLTVEERGTLVGLVPLVIRTETSWLGPVRVLTYPLDYWGSYYGALGADPARIFDATAQFIARQPRDWDVIDLRWIDHLGLDGGGTCRGLATHGLLTEVQPHAEVALVDLRPGWTAYWSNVKTKFRGNVQRASRRLEETGAVELVRFRPAAGCNDPRWDLFESCREITARSRQAQLDFGVSFNHPTGGPFLRELHAHAARLGMLDLCLLRVAGRDVAYNYNYVDRGYVSGLRRAFALDCPQGAGAVLMQRMLRDSVERGDHTIDLGPDYGDSKRYWLTSNRPSYRALYYAARNPRAQALHFARWMKTRLRGQSPGIGVAAAVNGDEPAAVKSP